MDKLEKGGNGQELLISSEEEPLHDHPLHIHMDLPGGYRDRLLGASLTAPLLRNIAAA